jgi:hypothetical protein
MGNRCWRAVSRLDPRSGNPAWWASGKSARPAYGAGVAARRRTILYGTRQAKLVVAALAALVAFVGAYAFAASLGSSTTGLAAGSEVIASCGSGMTFAYTTAFDGAASGYAVSGIELSNIPAGCRSKSLSATFYDSGGVPVGSAAGATLTASGTTQSIAIPQTSNTIDAGRVSGVSVVVF